MRVSPFDPESVFVWETTSSKAKAKAAPHFNRIGLDVRELSAKPTGLSTPSRYRDENVMVNEYEQNTKLRQDFPAQIRWLVKPASKTVESKTKIKMERDDAGRIKLRFA